MREAYLSVNTLLLLAKQIAVIRTPLWVSFLPPPSPEFIEAFCLHSKMALLIFRLNRLCLSQLNQSAVKDLQGRVTYKYL